jgi:hypothetical protein
MSLKDLNTPLIAAQISPVFAEIGCIGDATVNGELTAGHFGTSGDLYLSTVGQAYTRLTNAANVNYIKCAANAAGVPVPDVYELRVTPYGSNNADFSVVRQAGNVTATVAGALGAGATTLASATVTGALGAGPTTLASATVTGTLGAGPTTLASATVTGEATAGHFGTGGDVYMTTTGQAYQRFTNAANVCYHKVAQDNAGEPDAAQYDYRITPYGSNNADFGVVRAGGVVTASIAGGLAMTGNVQHAATQAGTTTLVGGASPAIVIAGLTVNAIVVANRRGGAAGYAIGTLACDVSVAGQLTIRSLADAGGVEGADISSVSYFVARY